MINLVVLFLVGFVGFTSLIMFSDIIDYAATDNPGLKARAYVLSFFIIFAMGILLGISA